MESVVNSFWKNRNAFVTGATGFVGAHVARALVEQGARVVCLQRDSVRANSLDLFDLRRRVTVVNGSVEDYALMERVVTEYEIEAIFHLAAQAIVGAANRSPLSTFEANIRGTYSLLEACRRADTVKRIVVASSDKAYGSHDQLPYAEDHPLLGLFPYDASKACADIIARSYAHTYRTPVAVSRFANIYGPGDMNLSRIIPGAIVSALRDEAPIIRSDGTPVREFVYVDDVARGYLLLAEKIDEVTGEAFNFGASAWLSMLDLVKLIIRLAGKEGRLEPRVMLQRKIEREIDAQYLSADKAQSRLGWRAEVSLDEGLKRAIEWYRAHLNQIQ
ncbi:MAG TPA: NAD-dependent epimerase/dehydratase family protein [Blastocatellia bacterium]|jgi:CDP-glucose 4,6-dehydratase|nr:NAD-dependent epimerase/dehydratase family protein [Blastocatellia bacterium]